MLPICRPSEFRQSSYSRSSSYDIGDSVASQESRFWLSPKAIVAALSISRLPQGGLAWHSEGITLPVGCVVVLTELGEKVAGSLGNTHNMLSTLPPPWNGLLCGNCLHHAYAAWKDKASWCVEQSFTMLCIGLQCVRLPGTV